jgi:hypothetical protein
MPAGDILTAAAAMVQRETFTRAQVAHLIRLAYLSGGRARNRLDAAELEHIWSEHPMPVTTAEDRRARQLADMEEAAARVRHGRPLRRFWPAAMPGGWPLPPTLPGPEDTWWPEDDGWPCPPPALRGQADQ